MAAGPAPMSSISCDRSTSNAPLPDTAGQWEARAELSALMLLYGEAEEQLTGPQCTQFETGVTSENKPQARAALQNLPHGWQRQPSTDHQAQLCSLTTQQRAQHSSPTHKA